MGKIVYLFMFMMTFIAISSVIFILDNRYNNIFALDFTPAPDWSKVNIRLQEQVDSLKKHFTYTKIDTYFVYMDESLIKKIDTTTQQLNKLEGLLKEQTILLAEKEQIIKNQNLKTVAVRDSARAIWLQSTVKLYETMDARNAANIIKSFPDDLAKEIIYSMKKKKAGEILSLLSPEFVSKITGAK